MPDPKYLTVYEVADELRVHYSTVYRLITDGQLTVLKVGARKLVPRWALDNFVEKNLSTAEWPGVKVRTAQPRTVKITQPRTKRRAD
ncbi:MAG: helix-turn-helix domain-containing protein [Deltaproteobacteria bacterium]|nr:helix-turn-helix domain-containing protein [Deltaproteobacteria bacterium]